MKNIILYLIILLSFYTFSCNSKVDYTNPSDVVLKYRELRNSGKIKESFELIADTCKSILTLQEYLDYYKTEDTIKGKQQFKIEIKQLPINIQFTNFRIFEVSQKTINLETHDTTIDLTYYTTLNENNKWKILWTHHIEEAARKLENEQKFEEANEILRNIFNYDPLNGNVYYRIGWNYYRLNNLEESNLYAKKAIEFSPKNPANYDLQAAIYNSKDMNELAIENYQIALSLCTSSNEKALVYCSIGNIYLELNQLSKSKNYLHKAIAIDSNDTYSYWRLANLFVKSLNNDSATFYFEKAVNLEPIESYLQQQLYYDYAFELLKEYKLLFNKNNNYKLLEKSKGLIVKALNLSPEDEEYKKLFKEIKDEIK